MIYATIETLHQIKYLQSSTIKILLFVLPFFHIILEAQLRCLAYIIFNEHLFKQEKKKKIKITKKHM